MELHTVDVTLHDSRVHLLLQQIGMRQSGRNVLCFLSGSLVDDCHTLLILFNHVRL